MRAHTIACTGASGVAGSAVVAALVERGASVRGLGRSSVLAISPGIELRNVNFDDDEQIASALDGIAAIVHCAATVNAEEDLQILRRVYAAAVKANVAHFVFIGVVGIEGALDFPYFKAKAEGEALVRNGPLPWTIQRATQFYEFLPRIAEWWTREGGVVVPTGARWRPIAAKTVGARLAALALGPARGRVADMVGPDVHAVADLLKGYYDATVSDAAKRPRITEGPHDTIALSRLAVQSLLGDANAEPTGPTFSEWLREQVRRPRPL